MNEEIHEGLLKELTEARARVTMIGEVLAYFAASD